jgi:trehalose 6-phosphate synthase/phosphatase
MRLLIVSNRLPLTVDAERPELPFKRSIGGLATGISSYLESIDRGETRFSDYLWIGWPGSSLPKSDQEGICDHLTGSYRFAPVVLSEETISHYYYGFCNRVIWPLFHCFPNYTDRAEGEWDYYRTANEAFFMTLKSHIREDDVIWIHDYHLMLLPQLIRREFPEAAVIFFLHIPFPAFDMFRHLSKQERSGIVEGLLGADLVGFHTADYVKAFLECVDRVSEPGGQWNGLVREGRNVRVGVFPMGIDFGSIRRLAGSDECTRSAATIARDLGGRKVVLSVDRLDYTKGIINRLIAFDRLLSRFPRWREKVVLMLVVAPSRREIAAYQQIKCSIDEWVGNINGSYGTNAWVPVIYQYRQLSLADLCALYSASDVAMVTPLKDGMNLIAKEYVAARADKKGVLILSEMAGAVYELTGAIAVNPHCIDELVDALIKGLSMEDEEQVLRMGQMQERLESYTVSDWASQMIEITLAGKKKTVAVQTEAI